MGIIIVGALIFFLIRCKGNPTNTDIKQTSKKQNLNDNPYNDLRNAAFNMTIVQLGLENLKDNEVYGVIMDWAIGEGIMTLITYKTGDASMYLSTGGGVIGGGQHENVNVKSKIFVEQAEKYFTQSTKTDSIQLPDKNYVKFYFLTKSGKYFAQEHMTNFENKSSFWMDYFNEANMVITELRLTADMK